VLVIDDLVATGGTMIAAAQLLQQLGARVIETAAVVDLPALGGAARIRAAGLPLFTLMEF
jgi:adenine phosphoribosyltransferase